MQVRSTKDEKDICCSRRRSGCRCGCRSSRFFHHQDRPERHAQAQERPIPRLVKKDGRFALFVDDAPYLVLGTEVSNPDAWPETLAKLWPALEAVHVNTVEIPIYWDQFEPQPGSTITA